MDGRDQKNGAALEAGVLYLVGTPLGNEGDFSTRALEVLRQVDCIACEDTRTTSLLLSRFAIQKQKISYHAHNLRAREAELLARLQAGERLALVSDAGMPGISDPGYELVQACVRLGQRVSVIPGPTALTTALAASGLDSRRFVFEGFLEVKGKGRKAALQHLANEERTAILYEAPHRLKKTLGDLLEQGLGQRRICLAREMTKRYEEFLYMTLSEALQYYQQHEPRGEYVLVLEGQAEALHRGLQPEQLSSQAAFDAATYVRAQLAAGLKVKVVAQALAKQTQQSVKESYAFVQRLKEAATAPQEPHKP